MLRNEQIRCRDERYIIRARVVRARKTYMLCAACHCWLRCCWQRGVALSLSPRHYHAAATALPPRSFHAVVHARMARLRYARCYDNVETPLVHARYAIVYATRRRAYANMRCRRRCHATHAPRARAKWRARHVMFDVLHTPRRFAAPRHATTIPLLLPPLMLLPLPCHTPVAADVAQNAMTPQNALFTPPPRKRRAQQE